MIRDFKEVIEHRRSYYAITNQSLISDESIEEIINFAILHVPSAFNSQTTRIVLLLREHHTKLWNIVKEELKKVVSERDYPDVAAKINGSFASGYGTVLFFENQSIVKGLQESYPLYKSNFPIWSDNTAGMHQLVVWSLLEAAGFGASLQHYHPLIDAEVAKTWNLDPNWKLTAQMPFGLPLQEPGKKEYDPISKRVEVFK